MNRKQFLQQLCQLSSAFEDCTDADIRRAGKYQMNMMSQKFQVDVLHDLGIANLVFGQKNSDFYNIRRKLAKDYPRYFIQQADLWNDLSNAIASYRNEQRHMNTDPMSFHHSFLRNAAMLAQKQLRSIDTRPKLASPKIIMQFSGRTGTDQFNDYERVDTGYAHSYWNEAIERFDMSKTRVSMFLQYKTRNRIGNEDKHSLDLPVTWGHQVKRLGITSLENKIVYSAEPCMTTEVHGALIEGFRAKWYKVDRKLGWTIEEGYIAKCDDMYRTCKSRMHIPTVAKRKVAKDVTNELLDALG